MEDRQKQLENFAREIIYIYDQSWASYESFYKYMAEAIKKHKKILE